MTEYKGRVETGASLSCKLFDSLLKKKSLKNCSRWTAAECMKYLRVQCSQWNKPTRCFFTIITTKLTFCEPDIRENHPIYAKYSTRKRVLADIDRLRRWLSWQKLQWFNPSKSILKGVFPSDRAVDFLYKRWNPSKSTIKGVFHWIENVKICAPKMPQ